jgi:tyrosyl-tRNA synthetase
VAACRTAQRALAEEPTTLVHGADQCAAAVSASKALFGQGDLVDLDEVTLAAAVAELPNATVSKFGPIADLFVEVGLAASKSAARRTVKDGGAYINNVKVIAEDVVAAADELLHGRWLVLRRGKKNLAAIKMTGA